MIERKPRKNFRPCQVCKHPERARIELLHASGVSLDKIAEKFGVSRDSVFRHMHRHVEPSAVASYLAGAAQIADLAMIAAEESGSVLDHLKILRSALFRSLDMTAKAGDHSSVVTISGALLKVLRQLGTLSGEIQQAASTVISISNNAVIISSPPFLALQQGLLEIARKHPGARGDIVSLFARLDQQFAQDGNARPAERIIDAKATEVARHVD